jgi:glyoxylase-like metal-dependent hydrolase (beta-lactamase superfamily II)
LRFPNTSSRPTTDARATSSWFSEAGGQRRCLTWPALTRSLCPVIWKLPLGAMVLYAIEDGSYFADPTQVFPGSDSKAWDDSGRESDGKLRFSIGCFVLTDGDRVVMVDTGMGRWPDAPPAVRAQVGAMPQALRTLGMSPGDVDLVIHTHLHPDHFGGDVTDEGVPFFPHARIVAHQADFDHFRHSEGWLADRVRGEFVPLVEAGPVELIDGPRTVTPGVSVEETPGHTPGHLLVRIRSEDSAALIMGDITHHPLQVSHPDWNSAGDHNPELAATTRRRVLDRAAGTDTVVTANHHPKPGFGTVEVEGERHLFASVAVDHL